MTRTEGSGQLALVTGASRGIGEAIAHRLARDGMTVVCAATRAANVEPVAREINALAGKTVASAIEVRVDDDRSIAEAFASVEAQLGPVTVLVNNAGVTDVAPFYEMSIDSFDRVVRVNLRGAFVCAHVAARSMIAHAVRGTIINVGSIAGFNAFPGRAGYCPSKAAVHHLTRVMALDVAEFGIRVNCVAPGYVRTDLIGDLIDHGRLDERQLKARTPMRRLGKPEEIAAAISWLTSDEASYVTGEVLTVDGGWVAHGHV